MKLADIQEMPLEELKADFMNIMSEVVERYEDNEDDRQSTESEQTSK